MKTRILILASLVAGLGLAACDKTDTTYPRDNRDAYGRTETRARAAETARPVETPSTTTPTISDDTRKEQIDATADELKVKRDKILDDVYAQYTMATGEKKDKDVPMTFKSHCDSAGKGDKVMGADKVKGFFARADVQQKCAEYVRVNKQIDDVKDRK